MVVVKPSFEIMRIRLETDWNTSIAFHQKSSILKKKTKKTPLPSCWCSSKFTYKLFIEVKAFENC